MTRHQRKTQGTPDEYNPQQAVTMTGLSDERTQVARHDLFRLVQGVFNVLARDTEPVLPLQLTALSVPGPLDFHLAGRNPGPFNPAWGTGGTS